MGRFSVQRLCDGDTPGIFWAFLSKKKLNDTKPTHGLRFHKVKDVLLLPTHKATQLNDLNSVDPLNLFNIRRKMKLIDLKQMTDFVWLSL